MVVASICFFLLGVIAIVISGEGTPAMTPTPQVTEPSAIPVTAAKLSSAYEDNEVAADAQYKGEIVDVTGVVETIAKDIFDTPYVVLRDGGKWSVWNIQCMFSVKDELTLAQLSKGQVITVRGKCDGYGRPNVIARNCKVVQS